MRRECRVGVVLHLSLVSQKVVTSSCACQDQLLAWAGLSGRGLVCAFSAAAGGDEPRDFVVGQSLKAGINKQEFGRLWMTWIPGLLFENRAQCG